MWAEIVILLFLSIFESKINDLRKFSFIEYSCLHVFGLAIFFLHFVGCNITATSLVRQEKFLKKLQTQLDENSEKVSICWA